MFYNLNDSVDWPCGPCVGKPSHVDDSIRGEQYRYEVNVYFPLEHKYEKLVSNLRMGLPNFNTIGPIQHSLGS